MSDVSVKSFLSFDRMITPSVIKILYYIGLVVVIIGGLISIFTGLFGAFGGGRMVIMGLIWLVVGPIMVRVYCELLIVAFKIHENLAEINARGKGM